jgi:hypothetical protein
MILKSLVDLPIIIKKEKRIFKTKSIEMKTKLNWTL